MWKKHWYKTRQWFSNLHAVFSMQFVGGGDSIGAKQLDQHWCPLARLMFDEFCCCRKVFIIQRRADFIFQLVVTFPQSMLLLVSSICSSAESRLCGSLACGAPSFFHVLPLLLRLWQTCKEEIFSEHGQTISGSWRQFEAVVVIDSCFLRIWTGVREQDQDWHRSKIWAERWIKTRAFFQTTVMKPKLMLPAGPPASSLQIRSKVEAWLVSRLRLVGLGQFLWNSCLIQADCGLLWCLETNGEAGLCYMMASNL